MTVIAGIDEAGRGPVLGPLVFGAVIMDKSAEKELEELGVTDSKSLSRKKRVKLYDVIKEKSLAWKTLHVTAREIDARRAKGETLNEIETKSMLKLLKSMKKAFDVLYIDAADVKADRYAIPFQKAFPHAKIISRHKADLEFVVVGAASVLAKVERDREIARLGAKINMELGSGYPSDPKTKAFLRKYYHEHGTLPDFVRQSWKTVTNLIEKEKGRGTLDKYLE